MRPFFVCRGLLVPLCDALLAEDVGAIEYLLKVMLAKLFVFDFDGGSVFCVHLLLAQEAHSKGHYVLAFVSPSEGLSLEALDGKHVHLGPSLLKVLDELSGEDLKFKTLFIYLHIVLFVEDVSVVHTKS